MLMDNFMFIFMRVPVNYAWYSRTPLIRPPSESYWCGRIRGMVAREGFVYTQNAVSVTRNVVVWEGWSLVRVVVRQGFYCNTIQFIFTCCLWSKLMNNLMFIFFAAIALVKISFLVIFEGLN